MFWVAPGANSLLCLTPKSMRCDQGLICAMRNLIHSSPSVREQEFEKVPWPEWKGLWCGKATVFAWF
jgi:hypothetical protein